MRLRGLRQQFRLDLAEVERNVGGYVFSTGDLDGADSGAGGECGGMIGDERADEGLPVLVVGCQLGGIQVMRDEFVDEEDGYLGVAALGLDESAGCGMEELVPQ